MDLKYEYDNKGIDEIISEKNDKFIAIREVRWKEDKPFKLDIRNYISKEEGDIALKGISLTDEEADTLTNILVSNGYGSNNELSESIIKNRPNLLEYIEFNKSDTINKDNDSRVRLFSRKEIDNIEEDFNSNESYYRAEDILL